MKFSIALSLVIFTANTATLVEGTERSSLRSSSTSNAGVEMITISKDHGSSTQVRRPSQHDSDKDVRSNAAKRKMTGSTKAPKPTPSNPELNSIAVNPAGKLQVCEGDCDHNSDCAGDLRCFKRGALEDVPGCSGKGISNYDYCVRP